MFDNEPPFRHGLPEIGMLLSHVRGAAQRNLTDAEHGLHTSDNLTIYITLTKAILI